ncbi:hypothetical protein Scep_012128 [Stephania cephalantha]|uniref:Uncharacterized protein n=1 Tax=Stephania cephalantha TaxID=152367 RepID=A0AAP0JGK0_9MAGN
MRFFVTLARIILYGESRAWLPEGLPLKLMNLYYCLTTAFGKMSSDCGRSTGTRWIAYLYIYDSLRYYCSFKFLEYNAFDYYRCT